MDEVVGVLGTSKRLRARLMVSVPGDTWTLSDCVINAIAYRDSVQECSKYLVLVVGHDINHAILESLVDEITRPQTIVIGDA
jgi:hypothetical protein